MSSPLITNRLQHRLQPILSGLLKPQNFTRLALIMPSKINYAVVATLLNNAFSEQIETKEFEFLEGNILQFQITDAKLFVGISYLQNRLICTHMQDSPCQADVSLSIDTLNAIQLIQQEVDPDTLFFRRKLKIKGDTELAHHVKNTIDTLNPEVIPKFIISLLNGYRNWILE